MTSETRVFKTWIGKEGICHTVVKPKAEIRIEDTIKNTELVKEISNGNTYPMLVDIRVIKSINKPARDYFATHHHVPTVKAIGVLVKSPVSEMIGSFFLGFNRPGVPLQLFTSKKKALTWLKQL